MNLLEVTIISTVLLVVYALYSARTKEMALRRRQEMAETVREILLDDAAPQEMKDIAIAMFHGAMLPNVLLRMLWRSIIKTNTPDLHPAITTEHQQVLASLMRDHFFKVNMLAGPHWYAIISVLLFIASFIVTIFSFGRAGYRTLARVEDRMMEPLFYRCFNKRHC